MGNTEQVAAKSQGDVKVEVGEGKCTRQQTLARRTYEHL